ncbi:hypothetical protein BGZ91_009508, partial [Linnemannia elongata]
ITTDNASNMAKMMRDLVQHPKAIDWYVVQWDIYRPGGLNDQPPENENLYPNDDEDEEDAKLKVVKLTKLKKLRMGIIKVRDVRTRWNSKFSMVDRAIDLKDAYQSICQNEPTLAAYTLEEDEWSYLERLRVLLSQFVTMTKTVSSSVGYPTINRAMSVYNTMIDMLEEFIEQEADPSLKQAAIHGKQKLLGYYSKTDSTPVYAVATAMDPRMRFDWWGANDWGEYIKLSKDM